MVDAISHNRKRLLPCVAILKGEYGQQDIAMGVPCVLDERGLAEVVALDLTDVENRAFRESAAAVARDIERLKTKTS